LNGAASRLVQIGDLIIIACYVQIDNAKEDIHKPKIILVDEHNMMI
jgi:aspartate 1-decarboxylase